MLKSGPINLVNAKQPSTYLDTKYMDRKVQKLAKNLLKSNEKLSKIDKKSIEKSALIWFRSYTRSQPVALSLVYQRP